MDGEKMSKSRGNMVFLHKLRKAHSANAVRLYLLRHHYRQVWEWSPAQLDDAAHLAEALETAARLPDTTSREARESFADALAGDLDTPAAIRILESCSGGSLRELGGVLGLLL
jgi:L-cysteine:1D-myo-inositol 2-amino-2-deoxy-alpha-D-glucopyranoside ligase